MPQVQPPGRPVAGQDAERGRIPVDELLELGRTPLGERRGHQDRGVDTPAFRPGRKRRFTCPEMSVVFASVFACSGTGLSPTPAQQAVLRDHCGHARYVWNLAVEQHSHWHPASQGAPGYLERCGSSPKPGRSSHGWPPAPRRCSSRRCATSPRRWPRSSTRRTRPGVRAQGRAVGFRITGRRGRQWDVRRVSRKAGQVWVPKAGWVRFRWSRAVPAGAKSYRVTRDRAGRRRRGNPAREPRTSPAAPIGVVVGIPRLQAGEDVKVSVLPGPPGRTAARKKGRPSRTAFCTLDATGLGDQPPLCALHVAIVAKSTSLFRTSRGTCGRTGARRPRRRSHGHPPPPVQPARPGQHVGRRGA